MDLVKAQTTQKLAATFAGESAANRKNSSSLLRLWR
jgi:hypothetical protein